MPSTSRRQRATSAAAALLATLAMLTVGASVARADLFPMTESFTGSAFATANWHTGGSALLTAGPDGNDTAGDGWLQLTSATGNQFGFAINDTAFPSTNGILVDFDYATYGGTGADGLAFFLYDGTTTYDSTTFHVGASGGSLGYAPCTDTSGSRAGVPGAYIGVGFDEFGNFTNLGSICGLDGTTKQPNHVSVRGSAADNYKLLGPSVATTEELTGDRTHPRHVTVAVTPDMQLSVYIRYPDGTYQKVAKDFQLPSPPASGTLKFGFAGSTGGSTNFHEIRNTKVVKPADLTTTVTDGHNATDRDGTDTWTVTVTNGDDNDTVGNTVKVTSPNSSLKNISWTCTTTTGGACATASGTGLPDTTTDLPKGATATYEITAQAADAADVAELAADAQPTGATGELNPTDNAATDTTDLTPVADTDPSIAVTNAGGTKGTASFTTGSYRGGDLTVTRNWQSCDPDGTNCADIDGATGTTYTLDSSMRDHALRLREHVSNGAGAIDAYSSAYKTFPDTTVTGGPTGTTQSTGATFTTTADKTGSAFECDLDDAGWIACPASYTGLADGTHTVQFRAVYAALADQTPASRTWTVDTTAPDAPAVTAPADGLVTRDTAATITLTGEPGADLEVDVDGTARRVTLDGSGHGTLAVPGPLAEGAHTVRARATDAAGNTGPWSAVTTWTVKTSTHAALTGPPAGLTGSAQQSVSYTGEPGATYEIVVDGSVVATGVVDGSGQGSVTLPHALADGAHTLAVRVTDVAGNVDSHETTVDVDTSEPAPVRFTSAPAEESSQPSPWFAFTGEPGSAPECALDGGGWGACPGQVQLHELADGAHVLRVRVRDAAGNVSAPQSYAWTIDTAAPAVPAVLGGPDRRTTGHAASFELSPDPGATLECSVDGKVFSPCAGTVRVRGLSPGRHSLAVRQIDAAGNVSRTERYEWRVTRTVRETRSHHVRAVLAPKATVADARAVAVGCDLDTGALRTCHVALYHHGHRIGRRTVAVYGSHGHAVAHVRLNARGRRLLRRALGGLPVRARVTARNTKAQTLHDKAAGVLYPPHVFSLPVLFDTDRAALDRVTRRITRQIARQVRHARSVVCEGYTDTRATRAYNRALGRRRARTVCARLRSLGVHARMRAVSYGEARPRASNRTAHGRHLNRRVIVRVAY